MTTRILVIGSGVVGLCVALSCLRRGFAVTLVDRDSRARDSCSFGNAGMIVPSHFVPLAAPGAVRLGLKWMLDPAAPFHIRPRLSLDLLQVMADTGKAWPLIQGDGTLYGHYLITGITTTGTHHFQDGAPRKIDLGTRRRCINYALNRPVKATLGDRFFAPITSGCERFRRRCGHSSIRSCRSRPGRGIGD